MKHATQMTRTHGPGGTARWPVAALVLAGFSMALPVAAQVQTSTELAATQLASAPAVAPVVVDAAAAPVSGPVVASAQTVDREKGLASGEAKTDIGNSTQRLLALQRSGQWASPVPRPVPGEIAQRSRERYLKSFEREIPETFQSTVGTRSGQTSGTR